MARLGARRRDALLGLAAASIAWLLVGGTPPARGTAAPTETRPLEELWSRYPLVPKGEPAASPSTPADDRNEDRLLLAVLIAVGMTAIAGTVVVRKRKFGVLRAEGAAMSRFRPDRRQADSDASLSNDEVSRRDRSVAERVRAATADRGDAKIREVIPEIVRQARPDEGAEAERAETDRSMPDAAVTAHNIGEHLASVLQSAQQAARTIEEDARRDAAALIAQARREADETRSRSSAEAATKNAEAEHLRQAAREESEQTRSDADEYAQQRRQEAEERAAATLRDAKAEAASIAQDAKERHEELLSNVAMTEDRLKLLSGALKNVARKLDGLVEDGSSNTGGRARLGQAQAQAGLDEALRGRTGATT